MPWTLGAIGAMLIIVGSATSGHAADFNSVVETVLSKQPQITKLPPARRTAMFACVKDVLKAVPSGKKRHVAASANYNQMEDRFGELVLADRARFKQEIAQACGSIAAASK